MCLLFEPFEPSRVLLTEKGKSEDKEMPFSSNTKTWEAIMSKEQIKIEGGQAVTEQQDDCNTATRSSSEPPPDDDDGNEPKSDGFDTSGQ